MTGYGRSDAGAQNGQFAVEVRSVNNRYIDVQVKTPRSLAALEPRVKKAVQERFSRGRFDVFITRNGDTERAGRLSVNEALAQQYIGLLRELKSRFALAGDVDLALVAGVPDIITMTEVKDDIEALWQTLFAGLGRSLEELDRMRAEEGAALVRDIAARITTIDTLTQAVRRRSPLTVEIARKRMTETVGKLLNEQPEPGRLAQEIAILAERTDVTEELTRLDSHVRQLRAMLSDSSAEAVGRKLDFLMQEMGREANTIASKAMDAEIAHLVVDIKAELEKIREQVQNIE